MADELTPKQERFAQEYLVDLNATQAAIRAGYSPATANEQGSRLLAKASVQEAVRAGRERIGADLEKEAELVRQELTRIGLSDIRKLYDDQGNLKPIHELDDDTAATLAGIEVEVERSRDDESKTITRTHKIKRYEKVQALNTLARWYGKLKDRTEHTGPNGGPIQVKAPDNMQLARYVARLLAEADMKIRMEADE